MYYIPGTTTGNSDYLKMKSKITCGIFSFVFHDTPKLQESHKGSFESRWKALKRASQY